MARPRKAEPRLHLHLKIDAALRERLDAFLQKRGYLYRGAIAEVLNELIDQGLERRGF